MDKVVGCDLGDMFCQMRRRMFRHRYEATFGGERHGYCGVRRKKLRDDSRRGHWQLVQLFRHARQLEDFARRQVS